MTEWNTVTAQYITYIAYNICRLLALEKFKRSESDSRAIA